MTKKIKLTASDGQTFEVEEDVAKHMELINGMMDSCEDDGEFPLGNVNGETLKKVLEWCEFHKGDTEQTEIEKPLRSTVLTECGVSEWDAKFIDMDNEPLFNLVLAANYLDVRPLLDLACAKIASMMKGRTPKEIREIFNIKNDFTPAEEEAVKEENRWCEEI